MIMIQEPLVVSIYEGGDDSVCVGGSIRTNNISSSDKTYSFNVVIL